MKSFLSFFLILVSINVFAQQEESLDMLIKKREVLQNNIALMQEQLSGLNTKIAAKQGTTAGSTQCSMYVQVKTDKISGRTTNESTNFIKVFGMSLKAYRMESGTISLTAFLLNQDCVQEDNDAEILFRDGTRMRLTNSHGTNCKGVFNLNFGGLYGNEEELKKFVSTEIESIRIYTLTSSVTTDLRPKQSKDLLNTLHCLYNQ